MFFHIFETNIMNMEKLNKKHLIILIVATEPPIEDCDKLVDEGIMIITKKGYKWVKTELNMMTEEELRQLYERF